MTRTLITLFCLFSSLQSFAADVVMKIGVNNSWFATEGGNSEIMPAFGFGVQLPLDSSQRIKLGFDAFFVEQKMVLINKTRPKNQFSVDECEVLSSDLYIHYDYIHFPVYLNSTLLETTKLGFNFMFGVGLKLKVKNSSDAKNYNFINTCRYDYDRSTNGDTDMLTEAISGIGIRYKKMGSELVYHHTLSKTKSLYGFKIKDHIQSIKWIISIYLN